MKSEVCIRLMYDWIPSHEDLNDSLTLVSESLGEVGGLPSFEIDNESKSIKAQMMFDCSGTQKTLHRMANDIRDTIVLRAEQTSLLKTFEEGGNSDISIALIVPEEGDRVRGKRSGLLATIVEVSPTCEIRVKYDHENEARIEWLNFDLFELEEGKQ